MKSITINGSKRESVGKKATKALRNAEMVPCVLYGEKEPLHFAAKELDFSKLIYTPNAHTVVIKTEDGTFDAVLQDIQFHPVTDKILHIDFYQLNEGKEISINIPVVVEGAAPGVLNSGGTLILNKRKLRVRALPKNLPDVIVADISKLELGNKLYTAELASDDYSFLHPDNTVVCQVKTSRASIKEVVVEDTQTAEDTEEASEAAE
ncbi:50S ribosomal protein L25/general stress protein Ctc [Flavobacteriaceae bacterium]|nr:50S ribosomal protein L25/general stress protein Ctc [Flavobacteriaceae bacterium]MDC1060688.1 50S ribosomal protein L25/general stress protein Ctc [Flavobacteriaceae bacterium]